MSQLVSELFSSSSIRARIILKRIIAGFAALKCQRLACQLACNRPLHLFMCYSIRSNADFHLPSLVPFPHYYTARFSWSAAVVSVVVNWGVVLPSLRNTAERTFCTMRLYYIRICTRNITIPLEAHLLLQQRAYHARFTTAARLDYW